MVLNSIQNKSLVVLVGGLVTTSFLGIAIWFKNRQKTKHRANIQIKMFEALEKPWVHIGDRDHVESVLNAMIQDGDDNLQIIADFDRTLTAFRLNGRQVDTCHQALDNASVIPQDHKEKLIAIRDHYYAIETNPKMTKKEKSTDWVEWWTKAHDLMVKANLTRSSLKTIVAESNIQLRSGSLTAFDDLHRHKVPLLIFSAGVGDVIVEALKQRGKLLDNMKVVSNYMEFNAQDQLVGFQGDMIHIFNKNESAIHKSDYFNSIKHRHNIILMGDSVGDLHMADGAYHMKNILRIGFLNDKIEAHMEEYKKLYDIVLVNDQSMDVFNAILKKVL